MTSEKKDRKYEFRANRSKPKRTNGSAPSRPWRTPDCYAVVFQHVSPVQANLNDGYIGEPLLTTLNSSLASPSKLQATAARMQQKQKKAKKAKVSLQSFWVSHIPSPHRQTRWTLVNPL